MTTIHKFFGLGLLSLSILLITSNSALALGKPSDVGNTAAGQGRMQAQTHLTEAKLKACQARENAIQKRSTHLVTLVTTMESKFDAIAARVEDYYTSKVVLSGKTVVNYDTLVADIQTKKNAVQTAVTAAQTNSSFDCSSANPKEQMTQFRTGMGGVRTALKEYRTSIKNLIVAVHSVTGETESENAGSPKPTGGQ